MTTLLLLAGLNHKTAPVEIREKVAVPGWRLAQTLAGLKADRGLDEVAVLSTCNRTEVYTVIARPTAPDGLSAASLLTELMSPAHAEATPPDVAAHLYGLNNLEAAGHLFRVACGLDSLVLGESEILGQVKAAYDAACTARTAGPVCHALFQGALRTGARARSETSISACAVSIPYVSLGLARKVFADLAGKRALLVGTGEIGRVALRHLAESGLGEVVAANRTLDKAERALAELELGSAGNGCPVRFRAVTLDGIPEAMAQADIVLACSEAPHYVINPGTVARVIGARRGRPLLLVDLGIPRQIDPALGRQEGVYLFDLDDLESVVQANLEERRREAGKVEKIIADEVGRFDAWRRRRRAVPVIRSLHERAEAIREEELERFLSALGSVSAQDRAVVEAFSRRLTNRLLDYPTVTLRELAVQPDGTPVADLFGRVLRGELAPRRDRFGGGGTS